jgi:hypothetical protein
MANHSHPLSLANIGVFDVVSFGFIKTYPLILGGVAFYG